MATRVLACNAGAAPVKERELSIKPNHPDLVVFYSISATAQDMEGEKIADPTLHWALTPFRDGEDSSRWDRKRIHPKR